MGGKPYSRTGGHSVKGHNTTKRGSEGVLVKNGDVPWIGFGFPNGGFVLSVLNRDIYICEDKILIIFLLVGINRLEKKENNFVILKRGFRSRRSHVIC